MANVPQQNSGASGPAQPGTRFTPSTGINPGSPRTAPGRAPGAGPGRPLFSGSGLPFLIPLGVALIVLLALCGGITWLVANGSNPTPTPASVTSRALTPGALTPGALTPGAGTLAGMTLGTLMTASAIDSYNRPTTRTSTFTTTTTVYAVFSAANVAKGTTFFARWTHEGQVYDDSPAITAQQVYSATFIEFHMQPSPDHPAYPKGNYAVQIYANGTAGPRADFVVR